MDEGFVILTVILGVIWLAVWTCWWYTLGQRNEARRTLEEWDNIMSEAKEAVGMTDDR